MRYYRQKGVPLYPSPEELYILNETLSKNYQFFSSNTQEDEPAREKNTKESWDLVRETALAREKEILDCIKRINMRSLSSSDIYRIESELGLEGRVVRLALFNLKRKGELGWRPTRYRDSGTWIDERWIYFKGTHKKRYHKPSAKKRFLSQYLVEKLISTGWTRISD